MKTSKKLENALRGYGEIDLEELLIEIRSLEEDSDFLSALEQAGVDNWSGYSFAFEILEETKEN